MENYIDPPKETPTPEADGGSTVADNAGAIPTNPSHQMPPTLDQQNQVPQQIVWRKGKGGKNIPYDPAKDKVCSKYPSI